MSLSLALTLNAIADIALVGGLTWFMSRPSKLTPHVSVRQDRQESDARPIVQPAEERERIAA